MTTIDRNQQLFDRAKALNGLRHAARHGITSMVNMDGNRYTLELLREIQAEGNLLARVKVPFHLKPHMDLSELDRAEAMTRDFNDEWLQSGFVKMFMDGVVDSRTISWPTKSTLRRFSASSTTLRSARFRSPANRRISTFRP